MKKINVTEVIKMLERSVDYYASRIKISTMECDDIKQEVKLRIFKAFKNYDQRHSPKTYFMPVIKNEVYRLYKLNNILNKRYMCYENFNDMTKVIINDSNHINNPELEYIKKENIKILNNINNEIKDNLQERTKIVFESLLKGISILKISKRLNLSISAIYGIKETYIKPEINKIMEKYKNNFIYSVN